MNNLLGNRTKDITNQRFGSLTAICPSHKGKNNAIYWKYQCDCGKEHIARANTVTYEAKKNRPNIPSCGCVELANKTKHGYRKKDNTHPTYMAYRGIMSRCYNEKDAEYKWYGAKGVTICNEWKNNPKAFIEWSINNGWKKGLHIDKDILCNKLGIHPGIYSPETCQWVTPQVNVSEACSRKNYGKHPNIKLSPKEAETIIELYVSGVLTNMSELGRKFGVNPGSISLLLVKAGVK